MKKIMALRNQRGGALGPTTEVAVSKTIAEKLEPSASSPLRNSGTDPSATMHGPMSEPAEEPGLPGEREEEEANEFPIPPLEPSDEEMKKKTRGH